MKKILLLFFIFSSFCNRQVETFYEKLNAPLGLKIEVHSDGDGHLVTFYGDNRGKHGFKEYALFEETSIQESRDEYRKDSAVASFEEAVLFADPTKEDVDIPIQLKIGGIVPASGIPHWEIPFTSGNFLTVRALPEYPDDKADNSDPREGPTPSHPSNTVLIPPLLE